MALDALLLEILACPEDKGPLYYVEDESFLYNPRLTRKYAVRDDIPVMLIDEAETVDAAEHERIMAKIEAGAIKPTFDAVLSGAGTGTSMPIDLDTQGIWDVTVGLPEQVATAAAQARGVSGLPDRSEIEHVVVMGMGGSGIAGDLLLATAAPFMPVPVVVVKGYECPHFVGEGSLVFAVSFSGNTEETIQAVSEAAVNGARVVAVTSGGELSKLASGWGAPVVAVPDTFIQPRTALGAMAIPPLVVLEEIGLFPGASQWIARAVDQLRRRRDQIVAAGDASEAADVARRIGRTIPLVHGGGDVGATAAGRWKTQVNENANAPAFWSTQPELCHNEIQGWGQHGDVTRQVVTLVSLRHDGEHPQVARRFDLVAELMREIVADIIEVRAEGDGDLAQLLDLILLGDFVSLELAGQEGIDPGPVPTLASIKQSLSQ